MGSEDGNIKSEYTEVKNSVGNVVGYDLTEKGIPHESHIAARAAYDYGTKFEGAMGRLLTYSEATALETMGKTDIIYGGEPSYWLGTAMRLLESGCVEAVINYGGELFIAGDGFSLSYGVRPVIEISKSSKSIVAAE